MILSLRWSLLILSRKSVMFLSLQPISQKLPEVGYQNEQRQQEKRRHGIDHTEHLTDPKHIAALLCMFKIHRVLHQQEGNLHYVHYFSNKQKSYVTPTVDRRGR